MSFIQGIITSSLTCITPFVAKMSVSTMEAFSVPRLKAASESEMVKSLLRVNDASATEVSSALEFPPNALGMSDENILDPKT